MSDDLRRRKPWCWGPLELIRHADGHLRDGGDTDRRIALIGFDNAVEVCIDVFLNLHPRLRGGYELEREKKVKFLANFHTKIEFLDSYVATSTRRLSTPVEALVWYHSLRNDLYHSGNGMVPELHVIQGARQAAIDVFSVLFDEDPSSLMEAAERALQVREAPTQQYHTTVPGPLASSVGNARMDFLSAYIDFERELRRLQPALTRRSLPLPASRILDHLPEPHAFDVKARDAVDRAAGARNAIVHGGDPGLSEDDLVALSLEVMDLTELLARVPPQAAKRGPVSP